MSATAKEIVFIALLISTLLVASSANVATSSQSSSSTQFQDYFHQHTWVVNHFSQLYTSEEISSSIFWLPEHEDSKWFLKLVPCFGSHDDCYISLWLCSQQHTPVNVNFTLSTRYSKSAAYSHTFTYMDCMGSSDFTKRNEVYPWGFREAMQSDLEIICSMRLRTFQSTTKNSETFVL